MNQEANRPEMENSPRRGEGLSDDQISEILRSLPRETASLDFTDRVVARVARPDNVDIRSEAPSRLSGLATLMFGPRPGFGMLLASSAAVALVAGLAWSQFFGAASQNDAASSPTVASADGPEAASSSSGPASSGTVRGTRVGTATAGSSIDRPAMPSGYPTAAVSVSNPESEQLRADYLRLQRQLMLLRQLENTQSPMVEIGSNGDVHYMIDLSDYMKSEGAQPQPPQF